MEEEKGRGMEIRGEGERRGENSRGEERNGEGRREMERRGEIWREDGVTHLQHTTS